MGGTCSTYYERGGDAFRVLVGKSQGKRALGRPREDNIKMDLQAVGWETWTGLNGLKVGTGGGHL